MRHLVCSFCVLVLFSLCSCVETIPEEDDPEHYATVESEAGFCDLDSDGFRRTGFWCRGNDCDDFDPNVSPAALELCDGLDNNCNAVVDEGCHTAFDFGEMDVAGDSVSKAVNADEGNCTNVDQESLNWATSYTNGGLECSAGPEGVYSVLEMAECTGAEVTAPVTNSAEAGATMLADGEYQAQMIAAYFNPYPPMSPRLAFILLGHNDICGGTVPQVQASCPSGSDQDPNNHCRTTADAFAREFYKMMEVLVEVEGLTIVVVPPVRISVLCKDELRAVRSCQFAFYRPLCEGFWRQTALFGQLFGLGPNGICGSLTFDCDDPQRVIRAFDTWSTYVGILRDVSTDYADIPMGEPTPYVWVGGELVGGTTRWADDVVFTEVTAVHDILAEYLSCCDCFHPSIAGQNAIARTVFEGFTCSEQDPCCVQTGDPLQEATCAVTNTDGVTFVPGAFPTTP